MIVRVALLGLAGAFGLAVTAAAQQPPTAAPNPGRDAVMSKCFQCHTDAMFRDHHQERRGWEATIYRMIGRGALYSPDEIKLMADYLATDFGPNTKPPADTSAPAK
jgi:mono/diheme cytochrome c family protein